MGTTELKKILISKIAEIDDEALLSAIDTILNSKLRSCENQNQELDKTIILTEQQKNDIQNSREEYLKGNFIENDVLNEEMEKWLREK